MSNLLNGTFEFVHVTLKERKVREEKVLELGVFFLVGGEQKDDTDSDLLLPGNTQTRPAVLIGHVEALLHRPGTQTHHWIRHGNVNKAQCRGAAAWLQVKRVPH